jgi:hypothetical protein
MQPHRWQFIRSGGVDQVVIRSGADVVNLELLDQKLWVALACPTHGLAIDARTLELIDSDGDGRIRPPELIAATRWIRARLRDPDDLLRGGDEVYLAAIDPQTSEGRDLLGAMHEMHEILGTPGAQAVRLADVQTLSTRLAERRFNGDGVIVPAQIDDPAMRGFVEAVEEHYASAQDRSGEHGLDRAAVERLLADLDSVQKWRAEAAQAPGISPLGDATPQALDALVGVEARIDDYFLRCDLAAFDPTAAASLDPPESLYRALALRTLDVAVDEIERLPLAVARPDGVLPLVEGINPAWRNRLDAFRRDVAQPILGRPVDALNRAEWNEIRDRFAARREWLGRRPVSPLVDLPAGQVAAVDLGALQAAFDAAIFRDEAAAAQNERFAGIEKLLHFQRDLLHLLNNFVSFAEFYAGRPAIFAAGTLFLDARSCDLTVHVDDLNKHPALAGLAKAYLAYCECRRGDEKRQIVAVFTAGDVDFLLVGRNGVFYDRKGQDWDATIVKIVENPIGIRQAFLAPYKKFVRMVEEQVAKRAAASEAGVHGRLSALAMNPVQSANRPPAGAPGAVPAGRAAGLGGRIDVGTVAALGVALGSISTVFVAVFAKFVDLGWWIPVAVLGIVLGISGPSMLIAWLKLRQRSLGPILDASGWAINGRMRINVPLGAALSKQARLPPGADHRLRDPYADRHPVRMAALILLLLLALALGWRTGTFDRWLLPAAQTTAGAVVAPERLAAIESAGSVAGSRHEPSLGVTLAQ